jgi:glycosyltransferase involved in cell wall biosynthesis
MSKVAVITPLYNASDFILKAMQSVEQQNKNDFTVTHFIYDDASTDNSRQIVNDNKTDNIRFITSDENKGQSHARNILIELAIDEKFDYIAFLDADDEWHLQHLQNNLKFISDDIDIVYSDPIFYNTKQEIRFFNGIERPIQFIGKQLEHNNFIWISGVVLKSKCMIGNEFDSSLNGLEDWDMWITLYKQAYRFKRNREVTFKYLIREGGQASTSSVKAPLVRQKHNLTLIQTKLNVACGHDYQEGYINADLYAAEVYKDLKLDAIFDVQEIPYEDNCVDEIRALHVIEHFDFFTGQKVLKEWYRALKPGGKLLIETPDLMTTCKEFVECNDNDFRVLLYGHFFAHPWVPGNVHKFLFTEEQLRVELNWAGFKICNRIRPISNYVMERTHHLFLTMEAFK